MGRRLFIGDLHGCADELAELMYRFKFIPGSDTLYSVGDIAGKGPKPRETLELLRQFKAGVVLGNHDAFCLRAARTPELERSEAQHHYLSSLGNPEEREMWLEYIASWPLFIETEDLVMVHAGLEPGIAHPSKMKSRILYSIRTWDGKGDDLKSESNPPWFECVSPEKTVVFGHWAKRGLIDLPHFKGLDTGCVYGRKLTGWCPEERKFYQVPARKTYAAIKNE
ncbi:MAG TPA: metallophosphoesterase [Fibrobacteres bacterium]|nr:metallophosphoesterase [Fibrobacterota bacterium]